MLVCFRVMLTTAELHWESSEFATALPLLLQALALARQHHLQALASETILHLAFTQVSTPTPPTPPGSRQWCHTKTDTRNIHSGHTSKPSLHPHNHKNPATLYVKTSTVLKQSFNSSSRFPPGAAVSGLQLMLGVPEQALSVLHEAMEPVLAHGAVMDKGQIGRASCRERV